PFVPGSGVRAVLSSERNNNIRVPLLSEPTTAMRVASGEIAGGPYKPLKLKAKPGEGKTASTVDWAAGVLNKKWAASPPSSAPIRKMAAIQNLEKARTALGGPSPVSEIHFSSTATS